MFHARLVSLENKVGDVETVKGAAQMQSGEDAGAQIVGLK
jgi:hypothetical protein